MILIDLKSIFGKNCYLYELIQIDFYLFFYCKNLLLGFKKKNVMVI